jgi:hypothetical protein
MEKTADGCENTSLAGNQRDDDRMVFCEIVPHPVVLRLPILEKPNMEAKWTKIVGFLQTNRIPSMDGEST